MISTQKSAEEYHLYHLVNWALDKLLEVIPQISDSYKDTSIDIQSANNLV